jgi:hypothetical protein
LHHGFAAHGAVQAEVVVAVVAGGDGGFGMAALMKPQFRERGVVVVAGAIRVAASGQ